MIGGSGYIGSRLHARLLATGHKVCVLDPRPPVLESDTCALCDHTTVVVLAWPRRGVQERMSSYEMLKWTEDLKQTIRCQMTSGRQLIFISSIQAIDPISPYGEEKRRFEEWVTSQYGSRARVVRPATVYGLSPRPRWDTILQQMILEGFTRYVVRAAGKVNRSLVDVSQLVSLLLNMIVAPQRQADDPVVSWHAPIPEIGRIVAECTGAFLHTDGCVWVPTADLAYGSSDEREIKGRIAEYARMVRAVCRPD